MLLKFRSALVFGLCVLPTTCVWAIDDLDITIRVVDRQEARQGNFNRIELPRETPPPASATSVRAERSAESHQPSADRRETKDRFEPERRQFAEKKETVRESTREAMIETREKTRELQGSRELRDPAFRK
ncbi:MAG: hypothetical protein LBV36_04830 [Chromatiales bacterium]|jgi:hypothetical protein|nr:hypothetical protein [Chromatiales bacterium]